MKKIDITEKLSFDAIPVLTIKGEDYVVDASAKTMLEIMGLFNSDKPGTESTIKAYNKIFSEKERKRIEKLNLSFSDLLVVIEAAIELISGDSNESGEQ